MLLPCNDGRNQQQPQRYDSDIYLEIYLSWNFLFKLKYVQNIYKHLYIDKGEKNIPGYFLVKVSHMLGPLQPSSTAPSTYITNHK